MEKEIETTPKTEPAVVVSSDVGSDHRRPKNTKTIFRALVVILIVIVAGVIAYLVYNAESKPVAKAFVIDGKVYTKSQVKSLIAYPLSTAVSTKTADQEAFNYYKSMAAAQKLNIPVPSSAVNNEINILKRSLPGTATSSQAQPWVKLSAYDIVLQNELLTGINFPAKGYIFYFWFNQHEQYGPLAQNIAGNGSPTLIAADRSYAQSQADHYYNLFKKGSITATKLISDINNNTKLNQGYVKDANDSGAFGNSATETWQEQIGNQTIIKYINSQTKPGLSMVTVGQEATVPIPTSSKDYQDADFYFIKLNTLPSPSITESQFSKEYNSLKTEYLL